jgi:hypothetical protein
MIKTEVSTRNKRSRGRGRYGEARWAKKTGGVVVGRSKAVKLPSGKWIQVNCQKPPDVVDDLFSYENKHYKNLPAWLEKVMTQATSNCPEGLIPVAHVGDRECRTYYCIIPEKDWLDLHYGNIKEKEECANVKEQK